MSDTRGNIAREALKEQGLEINNDKLVAEHREAHDNGNTAVPAPAPAPSPTPDAPTLTPAPVEPAPTPTPTPAPATPAPTPDPGPTPTPDPPVPAPTPAAPVALEDDVLLQQLNEKLGTNYKTLAEAKPAPAPLSEKEQKELEEKEHNEAVAYAIQSGVVNRQTLDEFAVDNAKDPREIVYALFKAEVQKKDKTLTEDQIEQNFKEFFNEFDEEGSIMREMRKVDMRNIANNYLAKKYSKVLDIKNIYADHKNNTVARANYDSTLEKVVASIPRDMKFSFDTEGDGGAKVTHEYSFNFDDNAINEVLAEYKGDSAFSTLGASAANDKLLSDAIQTSLLRKNLKNVIAVVAKSHADKIMHEEIARRKNIPNEAVPVVPQTQPAGVKKNTVTRNILAEIEN